MVTTDDTRHKQRASASRLQRWMFSLGGVVTAAKHHRLGDMSLSLLSHSSAGQPPA